MYSFVCSVILLNARARLQSISFCCQFAFVHLFVAAVCYIHKKEKSHSHGISNKLIFKNRSLSGVSSFINAICYPIIQHVQFNYNKCHSRGVIIQVNCFSRSKGFEIPKWYFRGCFGYPFWINIVLFLSCCWRVDSERQFWRFLAPSVKNDI